MGGIHSQGDLPALTPLEQYKQSVEPLRGFTMPVTQGQTSARFNRSRAGDPQVNETIKQRAVAAGKTPKSSVRGNAGLKHGMGKDTFASIQVITREGRQFAIATGKFGNGMHAEEDAVKTLRQLFSKNPKPFEGARIIVVVEKEPCSSCRPLLKDFAAEVKARSIEAHVPDRRPQAVIDTMVREGRSPARPPTSKTVAHTGLMKDTPVRGMQRAWHDTVLGDQSALYPPLEQPRRRGTGNTTTGARGSGSGQAAPDRKTIAKVKKGAKALASRMGVIVSSPRLLTAVSYYFSAVSFFDGYAKAMKLITGQNPILQGHINEAADIRSRAEDDLRRYKAEAEDIDYAMSEYAARKLESVNFPEKDRKAIDGYFLPEFVRLQARILSAFLDAYILRRRALQFAQIALARRKWAKAVIEDPVMSGYAAALQSSVVLLDIEFARRGFHQIYLSYSATADLQFEIIKLIQDDYAQLANFTHRRWPSERHWKTRARARYIKLKLEKKTSLRDLATDPLIESLDKEIRAAKR